MIRVNIFIPVMPFSRTWPKTNTMPQFFCAFEASKCIIVVNRIGFFRFSVSCGYAYLMWSTCRLIQVGSFQARPSSISTKTFKQLRWLRWPNHHLRERFHHVPPSGVDVTPVILLPNTSKTLPTTNVVDQRTTFEASKTQRYDFGT